MASYAWVVSPEHPNGVLVELTAAEEAQLAADRAVWLAAAQTEAAHVANEATMSQSLRDRRQDALDLANALDANTATAAQQRAALALCLRSLVRLSRIVLEEIGRAHV